MMSRKREAAPPALILLSDIKEAVPKFNVIDSPSFLIGRSPDSNLTLLGKNISRKHCTFDYDEEAKKWKIQSHSRTPVSVQGKNVKANSSITLECGDKIKITPNIVFEFKCSPDSQQKCCMDFKRPRFSSDDEEDEDDDISSTRNAQNLNDDVAFPDLDDDIGYPNLDDDVALIPHINDVDEDISLITDFGNVKKNVASIPNVDSDDQTASFDDKPELPSTLPVALLPDSEDFTEFRANYSDSVTESYNKAYSDPVSPSGIDSLPLSNDNVDFTSPLTVDDLEKEIQSYVNFDLDIFGDKASSHQKLKDDLEYRLKFIRKLINFNSSCESYFSNPDDVYMLKASIEELPAELSKSDYQNEKTLCKQSDEKLNRIILNMDAILMEKTKLAANFVHKFLEKFPSKKLHDTFENSQNLLDDDGLDFKPKSTLGGKEHEDLVREKNDLQTEIEKYKEENKRHKENTSWQESRIKFLELKIKDKEKLEIELENAKEETELLEKQNADMKRDLANLEIMELEYKNILETNKYREEDKRDKDALQRTINTLESQMKVLKEDNALLLSDNCVKKDEITNLKKKCEELEEKIKEKIVAATRCVSACGSDGSSEEEYCCDMVKEVKTSLMDLMEKEFSCSICGEMLIESTVTNCNHVFCSFCLQEWKKKQKKCPFCRGPLSKEVRAVIIDDYITSFMKLLSEKMYAERMKVISDRTAKKAPPPPPTPQGRGRTARRNSRQAAAVVDLS
ncbi:uncharacterized protein LOC135836327 isoform X2 [Planococcus citri]|uniref:uncharacterized protein LOC135836327 isoform X2 n=1 Tax=Planococcus citri TaxID=170843 RepID=UPI0031F97812